MIVDGHVHVYPPSMSADRGQLGRIEPYFGTLYADQRRKLWSGSDLVAAMDKAGVSCAIVANFGWRTMDHCRRSNDYLIEQAGSFPGRIYPLIMVPPPYGEEAFNEIERCARMGAKGVGELMPDAVGLAADSPQIIDLACFAGGLGLPLLMHASEPVGHRYPGKGTATPDRLVELVSKAPGTRFVFAHAGGGLPFYALMPEVQSALENVWYDSAATPYLYRPDIYRRTVDLVGSDRLLYGSDAPLLGFKRAIAHLDGGGLSESERTAVMGLNALHVYGVNQ